MLLCDMCDRGFHDRCVDPKLSYKDLVDKEFFCNHCCGIQAQRVSDDLARVRAAQTPLQPVERWGNSPDAPEAKVGLRIELDASFTAHGDATMGIFDSYAPNLNLENDAGKILALVEAYSPARRRHLVLFDEPNPNFELDKQPSTGFAAAINDGSYLTYERDQTGLGSCVLKRGERSLGSNWYMAWMDLDFAVQVGKVRVLSDESLFCLCRRPYHTEPPPPMRRFDMDELVEETHMVECATCGEWYHEDCVACVEGRRVKEAVNGATWRCPLCTGSIKVVGPALYRGPEDVVRRAAVWRSHAEKQPAWANAGVEWQWWRHGPSYNANAGVSGEWVFALSTLRRFVNQSEDAVRWLNRPPLKEGQDKEWDASSTWPLRLLLSDAAAAPSMDEAAALSATDPATTAKRKRAFVSLDKSVPRDPPDAKVSRHLSTRYHRAVLQQVLALAQRKARTERAHATLVHRGAAARRHGAVLKVSRSGIHGWGLFAMESLRKDDFVIEFIGELVRDDALVRHKAYAANAATSASECLCALEPYAPLQQQQQQQLVLDATLKGNVARFINHACEPNCYVRRITMNGSPQLHLYTKRDIAAREELCCDYKLLMVRFDDAEASPPCTCGTKMCTGQPILT